MQILAYPISLLSLFLSTDNTDLLVSGKHLKLYEYKFVRIV